MLETEKSNPLRVGFFGGTFDPPHNGHVAIANQAIDKAGLDLLFFCPAYHAPLRDKQPILSGKIRLKMLKLITDQNDKMEISDFEIRQNKICYTYETLLEIKSKFNSDRLMVILGSDQFHKLSDWKFNQELAQISHFLVFTRDTHNVSPPSIPNLSYQLMKNDLIHCSSTEIRNRMQKKMSVENMVPSSILSTLEEAFYNN